MGLCSTFLTTPLLPDPMTASSCRSDSTMLLLLLLLLGLLLALPALGCVSVVLLLVAPAWPQLLRAALLLLPSWAALLPCAPGWSSSVQSSLFGAVPGTALRKSRRRRAGCCVVSRCRAGNTAAHSVDAAGCKSTRLCQYSRLLAQL